MRVLPALLCLAVSLPAAAEVELYGQLSGGLSISQSQTANLRSGQSQVEDFSSYIGLLGRLPLDGSRQTALIWQLEQDTPVSDGGSLREQFRRRKESGSLLPDTSSPANGR